MPARALLRLLRLLAEGVREEEQVPGDAARPARLRPASLRQPGVGFPGSGSKRLPFRALGEGTVLYLFIVFNSNYIITLEGGLTSEQKEQSKQGEIITGQSSYYLFSPPECAACARLRALSSQCMGLTDKGSQGCRQGYHFTFSAQWHTDYLIEIGR